MSVCISFSFFFLLLKSFFLCCVLLFNGGVVGILWFCFVGVVAIFAVFSYMCNIFMSLYYMNLFRCYYYHYY